MFEAALEYLILEIFKQSYLFVKEIFLFDTAQVLNRIDWNFQDVHVLHTGEFE